MQFKYLFLQMLFLFASFNSMIAQPDSLAINKKRLYPAITATALGYSATMGALSKVWYSKNDRSSFHFFNDVSEWGQMDKAGHTYITFHESIVFSELLQWCNLRERKALWIGATTAFAIQSSIEIFDGFATNYGASLSDIVANGVGAAGFVSQQLLWNENRIIPKFSFYTNDLATQRPNVLGSNYTEQLIKNYNGQTYWLAFNIKSFLFRNRKFPSWLAISLGYGARNMIYARYESNQQIGLLPYRTYLLSLDLDLSKIHTKSKFVNYIFRRLNMIHIPAPALEWNENGIKLHPYYF